MVFPARYRGWCEACDNEIEPGEDVAYNSDDQLVHEWCDDKIDDGYDPVDSDPFSSPW